MTLAVAAVSAEALAAKVLIVRQAANDFADVKTGIQNALGTAHTVADYVIDGDTKYDAFKSKVNEEKPDLLVVMDNKAVKFAQELNTEADPKLKNMRGIATMGLNLKKVLAGSKTIAGVAYEVPAFTVITQFRYIVKQPIKNVMVIYRKSQFEGTVSEAQAQLKREGVNLIALDAESKGTDPKDLVSFIDDNLKDEVDGTKVDAIWVLSDNALMNKETFAPFWVTRAREMKVPFLCGIEKFASKDLDFCSYSASPQHKDLGQQVSEMIFAVLEEGRKPADIGVDYILSVSKLLNAERLEKTGLETVPDRLKDVKLAK